jgi:predicted N-formylglutamate amidohydrolase
MTSAYLPVLSPGDPPAVTVRPGNGHRFLVVCDHASVALPRSLGTLGVSDADLATHIACDIGARWAAERVAAALDATLVCAGYSRLVVDCNRYPWDPGSMARQSAGVVIPGNADLTEAARLERLASIFLPYQQAIDRCLGELLSAGHAPIFVSIHSCTAQLNGPPRPWPIGIGYAGDAQYSTRIIEELRRLGVAPVGDNEPYAMEPGADYTTPEHALRHGLEYVQVEFRQDLIGTEAAAHGWADTFIAALKAALAGDRRAPDRWSPGYPCPHRTALGPGLLAAPAACGSRRTT